jgi:hypothetical protein
MSGDDLAIFLFFMSLAFGFGFEAVKAETTARRVTFGALSGVCLLAGIFWLQIKTVWPSFTGAVTSVATNPLAWFIVAMFILSVFAFHSPKKRNIGELRLPPPPAVVAPSVVSASSPTVQKVFIDVSPSYLTGLYAKRTSMQGDALAAAYIGKWITVTGQVQDISDFSPMTGSGPLYVQFRDSEEQSISALFPIKSAESAEKISRIPHGGAITVRGKIEIIDFMRVKLVECELIEATPS